MTAIEAEATATVAEAMVTTTDGAATDLYGSNDHSVGTTPFGINHVCPTYSTETPSCRQIPRAV
jgi:hypothetical protein